MTLVSRNKEHIFSEIDMRFSASLRHASTSLVSEGKYRCEATAGLCVTNTSTVPGTVLCSLETHFLLLQYLPHRY